MPPLYNRAVSVIKYVIQTLCCGEGIRMKKRWAAGILCILLLFQLSSPVQAAGKVYFVAAEESVLPLSIISSTTSRSHFAMSSRMRSRMMLT